MSEKKKPLRLLFTSTFVPLPPDSGGKLVPYNYITGLSKRGHDLTVVLPMRRDGDEEKAKTLREQSRIVPVAVPSRSIGRIANRVLLRGDALRIAYHRFRPVIEAVKRELHASEYDVILLDTLFTSYLIPVVRKAAPDTPVLLINHNVESLLFRRYLDKASPSIRYPGSMEHRRMLRAERRALSGADRVIALSEQDREKMHDLSPETRISVLPPGTTVRPGETIPPPGHPRSLLFLGTYRWEPNVQAARWLVEKIFPCIREKVPDAVLRIAGDDPRGRVKRLHDPEKGVHVLGYVKDSKETVRDTAIFLVPILVGGGVRLKILEALANERAVVSTALGGEGLPFQHDRHLLLADTPDSFAEAAITLLHDPEHAARLARDGRRLVEEEYGWDRIVERVEGIIRGM